MKSRLPSGAETRDLAVKNTFSDFSQKMMRKNSAAGCSCTAQTDSGVFPFETQFDVGESFHGVSHQKTMACKVGTLRKLSWFRISIKLYPEK